MVKQTLWAEITICGFIVILGFFFILFSRFSCNEIKCLEILKDFAFLTSIAVIVFSYVIGFLIHRSIYLFPEILKTLLSSKKGKPETDYDLIRIRIFKFNNERINLELDYQYNNLVVSRLLFFCLPFLGISIFILLANNIEMNIFFIITYIIIIILLTMYLLKNVKDKKIDYNRLLEKVDSLFNETSIKI